jgi:hypothetical protein
LIQWDEGSKPTDAARQDHATTACGLVGVTVEVADVDATLAAYERSFGVTPVTRDVPGALRVGAALVELQKGPWGAGVGAALAGRLAGFTVAVRNLEKARCTLVELGTPTTVDVDDVVSLRVGLDDAVALRFVEAQVTY